MKRNKENHYIVLLIEKTKRGDIVQLSRPEEIQWTDFKNLTNGPHETTLKRASNANPLTHILQKDLPVNDLNQWLCLF